MLELLIPDQDVALFLQATKVRTGLHTCLAVFSQVRPHYFCELLRNDAWIFEQDGQRANDVVVAIKMTRGQQ
jgi:hypothetical protein